MALSNILPLLASTCGSKSDNEKDVKEFYWRRRAIKLLCCWPRIAKWSPRFFGVLSRLLSFQFLSTDCHMQRSLGRRRHIKMCQNRVLTCRRRIERLFVFPAVISGAIISFPRPSEWVSIVSTSWGNTYKCAFWTAVWFSGTPNIVLKEENRAETGEHPPVLWAWRWNGKFHYVTCSHGFERSLLVFDLSTP